VSERFAFRCRTCGRLETSDHAAELYLPAACRVCGAGVVFRHAELAAMLTQEGADIPALAADIARCDPATKRLIPENWEVLADAPPERLAELGLTPEQVEAHEPWPRGQVPEHHRERHFGVPPAGTVGAGGPRAVAVEAREGTATRDAAGGPAGR
jgi:hypothetical protein